MQEGLKQHLPPDKEIPQAVHAPSPTHIMTEAPSALKAFECRMCGTCCYGEGGIRVDDGEIEAIARFLEIPPAAFVTHYCETRNRHLYIKTGEDGYCVFHDREKQCLVHPVNPLPCIRWPFYPALLKDRDTWKQAQEACPGINPDCPHEEFVRQAPELSK